MWLGSVILKEKVSLHSGFKFRYTTELRYLKEWHLNFTYGSLLPVQRESVGSQLASLCLCLGSSLGILSTHMQLTLKLSYIRKKKKKKKYSGHVGGERSFSSHMLRVGGWRSTDMWEVNRCVWGR